MQTRTTATSNECQFDAALFRQVKWRKFTNRNGHPILQRKFLAMVPDMLPGVVAPVFSQEQKGLTAAVLLQLLELPTATTELATLHQALGRQ